MAKAAVRLLFVSHVHQGTDPEDMIGGLEAAINLGRFSYDENGKCLPRPDKWLRGKRWLDCLEPLLRAPSAADRRN